MLNSDLIRILVIDDDEDDFLIMKDYIGSIENANIRLNWSSSYKDAVVEIAHNRHDIYFVDYRLGAKTGIDLLKDAIELKCEMPIILLTGKGNREIDREAMRVGAFDYLVKSEISTDKIERSIRYALDHSKTIKALRDSERKYRSIFESSKDAVFVADLSLRFKDCNPATSELLRYSNENLKQLTLYDLIDGDELIAAIKQGLEEDGEVIDLEIVIIDHKDEKKICILSASKHIQKDGEPTIQGIIHDITNLKKAEKATLHAEKLASAGRLVRTIAHEVRNPLNNIQMSVDHLDLTTIPESDIIFYDIIKRNVKRIDDLIAELLDSYRPSEKMFQLTDLEMVLQRSIEVASDRVMLKKIILDVQLPGKKLAILGDEEKLKIAFLNVIINATEAIQNDNGRISITLSEKTKFYMIEIADNGCGIAPEILSKLFEPYFTHKKNGMGLGLASTLNVIQSHNGTVDVKSIVDEGTSFIIALPQASSLSEGITLSL